MLLYPQANCEYNDFDTELQAWKILVFKSRVQILLLQVLWEYIVLIEQYTVYGDSTSKILSEQCIGSNDTLMNHGI